MKEARFMKDPRFMKESGFMKSLGLHLGRPAGSRMVPFIFPPHLCQAAQTEVGQDRLRNSPLRTGAPTQPTSTTTTTIRTHCLGQRPRFPRWGLPLP